MDRLDLRILGKVSPRVSCEPGSRINIRPWKVSRPLTEAPVGRRTDRQAANGTEGVSGMSVPAVRRLVVGVDGSVESVAALRWACREAALRGAEVHAVHAREELCHSLASYAAPAPPTAGDVSIDIKDIAHTVQADMAPGVPVRVEEVDGLAARVLLDRCIGADMLVLGTSSDLPGAMRSAGPVIRACLRRAYCPVVVISAAQDPVQHREPAAADERVKVPVGAGAPAPVGV